jgi:hypothetical protein
MNKHSSRGPLPAAPLFYLWVSFPDSSASYLLYHCIHAIKNAKKAVQAEYEREGFDMPGMLKRLDTLTDRGVYEDIADRAIRPFNFYR